MVSEIKLSGKPSIHREDFVCEQIMVPAHDGEQIPMNLYFKKGTVKMNRRNRVIMEGYGAYGINMHQGFDLIKVAAMERGWVIAQTMVRGGGERGIAWHNDGKLQNKENSF